LSTLDPTIETKLRDSFAAQSMMGSIGAQIERITPGEVTLTAPVSEGFRQQQDFGHAGLVFALGDSAAGYAALTLMPHETEVMTTEMKINLLRPAAGHLTATGRVLKPGRRLLVVTAEVFAENNDTRKQVAALMGTMIPVDP
jgi:uncharacterized protein (TIGR00369 family)